MALETLRLFWQRYSPMEVRLLAEVRRVLPPAAQEPFDAQVAAVTRVQRSPPSWSEISLYRLKGGVVDWSGVPLFPCTDEFRLAEVRFAAGGRRFAATLTTIGGHVFDFTTVPGPRAAAFVAWDGEPRATLLGDPLRAPSGNREEAPLPHAWEASLASAASYGDWRVHDRASAYRVVVGDGEYLVLAERGGDEFILHRIQPASDLLFYVPAHDGVPTPLREGPQALMRRGRLTECS